MVGVSTAHEAYCDHCHTGVRSRDLLVMTGRERLCSRCCLSREAMETRVRRISGWLLLGCTMVGAGIGYAAGWLVGLFPGVVGGLVAAAAIESSLRRY